MPVGNLNVEPTTDRSHAADTTNKSVAPEKRDLEVENLAISPVMIDRTLVFLQQIRPRSGEKETWSQNLGGKRQTS